jgi:hypothetical protein
MESNALALVASHFVTAKAEALDSKEPIPLFVFELRNPIFGKIGFLKPFCQKSNYFYSLFCIFE